MNKSPCKNLQNMAMNKTKVGVCNCCKGRFMVQCRRKKTYFDKNNLKIKLYTII